ncbi:MAG: hypothetical protein SVU32_04220 [Candidatus Nanohaloarchaea archaeon]|nr:hypothetical protein [Candidatus Nanohaloarchaea archaeon]
MGDKAVEKFVEKFAEFDRERQKREILHLKQKVDEYEDRLDRERRLERFSEEAREILREAEELNKDYIQNVALPRLKEMLDHAREIYRERDHS